MELYQDRGGNSGIKAYEIESDSITVEFTTGAAYLYNYEVTGASNVEEMKKLAGKGVGLNSFINLKVKYKYAKKLR